MEMSVPKTECMHVDSELVQHFSRVTASAADYWDTGKNGLIGKWSHPCPHCPAVYDCKHGLTLHIGLWCGTATRETFEEDYEVDRVLQARGPPEYRFYQVLWKGDWGDKQKTWEPSRHLDSWLMWTNTGQPQAKVSQRKRLSFRVSTVANGDASSTSAINTSRRTTQEAVTVRQGARSEAERRRPSRRSRCGGSTRLRTRWCSVECR